MNRPEDHELRAHEDHHASLRLWLRLLSCTTLIENRIRQQLRENFDVTLPRFDLMAQLERTSEGLTMGELSRRMMVSGGNVTALVDQLEKEGLVQRQPDPSDRRAFRVMLTPSGRRTFTGMAAQHESWVVELFGSLTERQQEQLHTLLGRLKTGLHAATTSPSEKA